VKDLKPMDKYLKEIEKKYREDSPSNYEDEEI
jgi:hypothetical protein